MQKFTCLTCRVNLSSADTQREHYKNGWHIYNLKRKLSNMAPIPENEYQIVLAEHTQAENTDSVSVSFYCESCRKSFTTEKAYLQHNTSKKHLAMLETKGERRSKTASESEAHARDEGFVLIDEEFEQLSVPEKDTKTVVEAESGSEEKSMEIDAVPSTSNGQTHDTEMDDEEFESIPVNECLFCSHESGSMEENIEHMSKTHSFFIPDLDYCCDLEGILTYLGMKIAHGRSCLYCSEYGKQFASKKSAQQHMLDKGHARIKFDYTDDCLEEYEDFYDYTASYPEGEDVSDDEVETDDMQIIPEDYQLRLPSGTVIGHRSLLVYYKQNLRPQAEQRLSSNKQLVSKVMSQYQMLGWTGISSEGAKRRAKDIQHWQRQQQRARLHLGKAANKTATLDFRCQTGFC